MTEKTRILIVDDDRIMREFYRHVLTGAGYDTELCENGLAAIQKLNQENFPLVVSDIYMPEFDGIGLLGWARSHKPGLKLILISGTADAAQTKQAGDLGCEAFLLKPIKPEDLIKTVQETLDPSLSKLKNDSDFAAISIADFLAGKKNIPYSIYVRLNDGRFIKIAHTGEDLDETRVEGLVSKGVGKFWLEKESFNRYLHLSHTVATAALSNTDIKMQESRRAKLVNHACEVAYENLRVTGLTNESFEIATQIFLSSLAAMMRGSLADGILENLVTRGGRTFSHASVCGFLCAMIARVMGWSLSKNILALTMGGFFHDLGMIGLPPEFQGMKVEQMTPDQRVAFEGHPQKGQDTLKQVRSVPKEVLDVVLNHHERPDGTGFPRKLSRKDLDSITRLVSMVDLFTEAYFALGPENCTGADSCARLVKKIEMEHPGQFAKEELLSLELIFLSPNLEEACRAFKIATSGSGNKIV